MGGYWIPDVVQIAAFLSKGALRCLGVLSFVIRSAMRICMDRAVSTRQVFCFDGRLADVYGLDLPTPRYCGGQVAALQPGDLLVLPGRTQWFLWPPSNRTPQKQPGKQNTKNIGETNWSKKR
eukprot:6317172-Amphidinium_carterae.1